MMVNKLLKIGIIPIIFFGIILLFSENFLEEHVFADDQVIVTATSTIVPPFPVILSLVANDPKDPIGPGFDDGDTLTLTFDKATSRPDPTTKSDLDALFNETPTLGNNYVGSWLSSSVLEITILDAAVTPPASGFTLSLKASGNLQDEARTSFPSTSTSPAFTGDFGQKAGPSITSYEADDPSNTVGFGVGDRLIVRFSEDTNTPDVSDTNALNDLFDFSPAVGNGYTGVFSPNDRNLIITITSVGTAPIIGTDTITVKATANLQSSDGSQDSTATSPPLGGTFGRPPGPGFVSLVADDPDGSDAIVSAGDTITAIFDTATNQPFGPTLNKGNLDALFTFSQVLTTNPTGITGAWIDDATLVITIIDPTGNTLSTGDGGLKLTVKESANLKDVSGNSLASNALSSFLSGNFGQKAGPAFLSVQAGDPDGTILGEATGLTNGDTITATFDQRTNRPNIATKANVDSVFAFENSFSVPINIGTNYVGSWLTRSVAQITILNQTGETVTEPPNLILRVKPGGNLKDLPGTSFASTAVSQQITDDFGLLAPPAITDLLADDPKTIPVSGFDNGDTITVRFDKDTTLTPLSTLDNEDLDDLFVYSQAIGDNPSGFVQNKRTIKITIDQSEFLPSPPVIGELQFTVKATGELRAQDGSVPSTAVSPVLSGTYGTAPGPNIIDLVAQDPFGTDAVFGADDTITVSFDVPTNGPDLFGGPDTLTQANLDTLLTFSSSLGSGYTGRWFDSQTLIISVGTPPTTVPAIGMFSLTVNEAAGLQRDTTSLSSISSSPLLRGDFGKKPGPSIVSIEANDPKATVVAGLDNLDTITITFDEATNQPPQALDSPPTLSKSEIDGFISFAQVIGTDYTGVWFDPLTLIITITNAAGQMVNPSTFTLSVIDDGTDDLNNSANTSLDSTSVSPTLIGNFGLKAGPSILALIADDPKSTPVPGFDNGDTITIIWSEKTDLVNPFTKAQLDSFFTTSQSIGDDYTGMLTPSGDLVITIVDGQQLTGPPVVDDLQLVVKQTANIQALGGSQASNAVSPFLSGNFGAFVDEVSLCTGGEAFSTFPDGKTAEISFAGTGNCGGFIFETTDDTAAGRIEFVGEPLRITPTGTANCAQPPFCFLEFVFREDQRPIDNMGTPETGDDVLIPLSEIKILKDRNDNGTIEQEFPDLSNEVFNGLPNSTSPCVLGTDSCTPQTTVEPLDSTRFIAKALSPSNSKFAIGGIRALALGAVAPGISSTPSAPSATGPAGAGAGGGGNAASVDEEGLAGAIDLSQVKLYEATWDKCDEKMLRVIAGPAGVGLSVKAVAAMGGIVQMREAAEQPFSKATVYELSISELETFIRVQVEGVIGREASLAQRSLDLRECTGSIGGYSESEDVISPTLGVPVGAFPSAATLFEDGSMFDTTYNDLDFGVGYWMPEGEITQMDVDEDAKAITFSLSDDMEGRFILSLPRGMISADDDQFILINPQTSEPMEYDILESGAQFVTLEMILPEGTNSVTVVGTSIVPEFGTITILVLVLAIVTIVVITRTRQLEISKL